MPCPYGKFTKALLLALATIRSPRRRRPPNRLPLCPIHPEAIRLPRRKRLPDVEYAKKYKTQQQIFPVERRPHDYEAGRHGCISKFRNPPPHRNPTPYQHSKELTRHFVHDDATGIALLQNLAASSAAQTPTAETRTSKMR